MIKMIHGIYEVNNSTSHWNWYVRDFSLSVIDDRSFPVCRGSTKIIPNFPTKFYKLIMEKYDKFFLDLVGKDKPLEFTFSHDEESGISAIAIVHPLNQFSKEIGNKIVTGRIKRMKGEIEKIIYEHDDIIIDGKTIMRLKRDNNKVPIIKEIQYRDKYDPLPVYIEV